MERPVFPKRAVITGGMPYGNKKLHFGHVGGVFVQADAMASASAVRCLAVLPTIPVRHPDTRQGYPD